MMLLKEAAQRAADRWRAELARVRDDERGVETLEVIMWVAAFVVIVGAVALIVQSYLEGRANSLP